jgi:AraC family transcriptional regulator
MQPSTELSKGTFRSRAAIKAYAREMAAALRLDSAPTFVSRTSKGTDIAIAHIKRDTPAPDPVSHQSDEDALLVSVSFLDGYLREFWLDGHPVPPMPPQPAGIITLIDRRRSVSTLFKSPIHGLQFYFPRESLRHIADDCNLSRFDDLQLAPCAPLPDALMHNLGKSLLPAFEKPAEVSRLFIDHVALAAAGHLLQTYSGLNPRGRRGGLAPWQQKRAEEMLAANLDAGLPLAAIAGECRLSVSHFTRAFRQTTGLPPHQWLLKLRVEAAKAKLSDTMLPLREIAMSCGFADQSHFTRVFSRSTGHAPGTWRRNAHN